MSSYVNKTIKKLNSIKIFGWIFGFCLRYWEYGCLVFFQATNFLCWFSKVYEMLTENSCLCDYKKRVLFWDTSKKDLDVHLNKMMSKYIFLLKVLSQVQRNRLLIIQVSCIFLSQNFTHFLFHTGFHQFTFSYLPWYLRVKLRKTDQ